VEPAQTPFYRFGIFTFTPATGELLKGPTRLRLQIQPARALTLLIERQGDLVTRPELQQHLWPDGINVDFEAGLNSTMRRLRQTLIDDADHPRYIETVPKRGYRWIAPVERVDPNPPPAAPAPNQTKPIPSPEVSRRRFWPFAGAAAAATAGGFWLYRKPTRRPISHTSVLLPAGQELPRANARVVTLSPDERTLAYVSSTQDGIRLFRRDLTRGTTDLVSEISRPLCPCFHPKTGELYWTSGEAILRQTPTGVETVSSFGKFTPVSAMHFDPAGNLTFLTPGEVDGQSTTGLASTCTILRDGSSSATKADIPYGGRGLETLIPQQLIQGRYLLYNSVLGPQARTLHLLDTQTGRRAELTYPATGGWFIEPNRVIYFWAGNLLSASLDLANMRLASPPRVVQSGIANAGWTGPDAWLTAEGTLVYVPERPFADWRPVWLDLYGRKTPIAIPPAPYMAVDMTRDGSRILIARRYSNGLGNLYLFNVSDGSAKEVARDVEWRACLSPDATRLAYGVTNPGQWLPSIQTRPLFANAPEWSVPFNGLGQSAAQWLPNTNELIYVTGFHPRNQLDILSARIGDSSASQDIATGAVSQFHPAVSPNGRLLAYAVNENGVQLRVRDRAIGVSSEVVIPRIKSLRDQVPMWDDDSSTLYYVSDRSVRRTRITMNGNRLAASVPETLFETEIEAPTQWDRQIFFDSHNKRFLASLPAEEMQVTRRIDIITNWLDSLS
jgi:DNA-binding winged helix-turn-helix (wHTH) protein/Tol biopolymer transport system component